MLNVTHNYCGIDGLSVIAPDVHADNRGFLFELYNQRDYSKNQLNETFIQDNLVFSNKNVLRGFHVNLINPQAKLISAIEGEIFDVAIDLRKNSPTYKKWASIYLSSSNRQSLYIPCGFGHAYLAMKDSIVLFKVTTHYAPGDEIGFSWNSSAFNVNWPIDKKSIILGDKDRKNKEFSDDMVTES